MRIKSRSAAPRSMAQGTGWQAVYTPFALIVLSLFILLSSFSVLQAAKVKTFSRGFAAAVSALDGGLSPDKGAIISPREAPMVDKESRLAGAFASLQQRADWLALADQVAISVSGQGLVLTLADHLLFDSASAELAPDSLSLLAKVAGLIAGSGHAVLIKGHSDDQPINTARYPSNWELSTARAVTVLRYFSDGMGIAPSRLSAAGYGPFQPLVDNDGPDNRARNRRVEIVFLATDQEKT